MEKRTPAELRQYLEELRTTIEAASPWRRSGHAWYRLSFSHVPSNTVITSVAVVEGLARCLVVQRMARSSNSREQIYHKVAKWDPKTLLRRIAADEGRRAGDLFGAEWEEFHWAVEYRNFLVHEGGLLTDTVLAKQLLAASESILDTLREVGRSRGITAYGRPRRHRR